MEPSLQLVTFTLGPQWYALRLSAVDRVLPAVEITPLPEAPGIVLGIVNVQGRIVPVVDVRRRFGLPEREVEPGDHMILARTSRREIALVVDSATGVVERPDGDWTAAEEILRNMGHVEGVTKFEDGLILIHDLESFLSLDEERELEAAMAENAD